MKKLTKRSLIVLIVAIVALIGSLAVACGDDETKPVIKDGPEMGSYYCETDDGEYTLDLVSGRRFTLSVNEEEKTGGYSVKDSDLTFKFDKSGNGNMSAVLADNILTVVYNESQMRFYKKVDYTVSFDADGGSAVDSVSVLNGKTVAKPASDPVREGHIFIGWYGEKENYETPFMFGTEIITGNTVLYARWVPEVAGLTECNIDFDLRYEGAPEFDRMQTKGGKLYNVPAPKRAGYTFNGWWVSSCEDPEKLSYILTDDTQFSEDTTLYALWQDDGSSRLKTPVVHVGATSVSWEGIQGASTYSLEIVNPNNVTVVSQAAVGTTNYVYDFSSAIAGEYTIKVTAIASSSENNSETAVRCYHNKSLTRTTLTVIEPSTLLFSEVANAEKYYVTVKCGDANHNHTRFDNGSSTNFNFANCPMSEDGITFVVTAEASGYAPSTSRELTYKRSLNAVTGLTVDEETQTLKWNALENATNYIVSVKCGNPAHDHSAVDNGNKLTYSLKECAPREDGIVINVYPRTKGYISPAPTKLTYNKSTLATPSNIRVIGTKIYWDAVANAKTYSLRIGNVQKTTADAVTEFDLNELMDSWIPEADYKLNIRANGDANSLWSDDVDMRYFAMYGSVKYEHNTVSWRHVIGAQKYEIRLNGKTVAETEDGVNRYALVLDQSGVNTIEVRFHDGLEYSAWASVNIYAYTVTFDTHKGTGVDPLYVAVGDEIELPTSLLSGYKLAGWYNTAGGAAANGAQYKDETFAGTGDLLLHAYWEPSEYPVTYDYEGGDGIEGKGTVTYTRHYKLEVPTIADGTKAFAGWYSESNGAGTKYTDEYGVSINPWSLTRGAVLHAHWVSTLAYTEMNDGTYSVGKGSGIGSVTHVTIPSSYNGKPISTIAAYAFQSCSKLVSLDIPDTVNIIATASAFTSCSSLREINVYHVDGNSKAVYESEDGVLIMKNALEGRYELSYFPVAKTGDYVVPSYITAIPTKAFASSQITSVVIPVSVMNIDANAFYNCKKLTEITFVKGGSSPLKFGNNAFYGCSAITSITIPERAEEFAVDDSKGIFKNCSSLVNINVDAGNVYYSSIDGVLCDAKKTKIVYCPAARPGAYTIPVGITTIGNSAFRGCTRLTSIVISQYVTSIEEYAFYGCSKLTSLTFRGRAIADLTVGDRAFYNCSGLTSVTFDADSRVVSLGNRAFYGCKELAAVTIPATMKSVGEYAFSGCTSLSSVSFAENGEEISFATNVFSGCTSLVEVYFPATVKEINLSMFDGCTNLSRIRISPDNKYYAEKDGIVYDKVISTLIMCPAGKGGSIKLPDSVTTISSNAFKGNVKITGIIIGKNVTEIGDAAFHSCTNLSSITFERGGTEDLIINPTAQSGFSSYSTYPTFYKCNSLTTVSLPSRLVSVGGFYECANLTRVTFDDIENSRLETIGSYAFSQCHKLAAVDCPSSLKYLGKHAFSYCDVLTAIDLPEGLLDMGDYAFTSCTVLKNVAIPSTVKHIGQSMFALNKVITSMTLPASVETMGTYIFSACENLREVTINCHITEIPERMFNLCASLQSINIPNTVVNIGTSAFNGCTSLSSVTFDEGGTEDLVIANGTSNSNSPFAGCTALEEVRLPSRTVTVGNYAFAKCTSLSLVTFGENSRLKTIGNNAFESCSSITEITIPNTVANLDPENETTAQVLGIGNNAFKGATKLETVTFVEGGELPLTIGTSAFADCMRLTGVNLPARLVTAQGAKGAVVEIVPSNVFSGCSTLKTITVENGCKMFSAADNILFNGDKTILVFVPLGRVGSVTVPKTVKEVANSVFADNNNVTEVIFESGGTDELILGSGTTEALSVFKGSSVSKITLPDRITTIAPYTFSGCSGLTTITIPKSVNLLGDYAFKNCTGLETVGFADNGADDLVFGNYVFQGCTSLAGVYLPQRLTTIGNYAFSGCSNLQYFAPVESTAAEADIASPYVLPSNITEIGNNAFDKCTSLEEIALSPNIVNLGNTAFNGCTSLKKVVLPKALERFVAEIFTGCTALSNIIVLDDATHFVVVDGVLFNKEKTELIYYPLGKTDKAYTVPDGVLTIRTKAFSGNGALESVVISNTVQSIEAAAFKDCSKLTTVSFAVGNDQNDLVIEDGSTSSGVFGATGVRTINFPARLTYLGKYAFYKDELLTNVTFAQGSRLTEIAQYAFGFDVSGKTSQLTSITLPDSLITIGNYAFSKVGLTKLVIPANVETIGERAFQECPKLTTVEIAANSALTSINSCAFQTCKALESVTFKGSSSLQTIGNNAFQTTKISSFVFEGATSLQSIGNYAFNACGSLSTIELPSSLTAIGNSAFKASALASIAIPASVTSIGTNAFEDCKKLTAVMFTSASSLTTIGDSAFKGCILIENIDIPDGVQSIGKNVFQNCSVLKSVNFGEDSVLETIGNYAFSKCVELTSIDLPDSVTSLGTYIFEGCTKLASVSLPDELTTLGTFAFQNCRALTAITLPDKLTAINASTFVGCGELTTVNIPASVTNIADAAFSGCNKLNTVTFADSEESSLTIANGSASSGAFYGCTSLLSVQLPKRLVSLGSYAFNGCRNLESVTFSDGITLTSIGDYAFRGCTALSAIEIPQSLKTIGNYAFAGCSGLETLTFKDGFLTTIGASAFSDCIRLESVIVPESVLSIGERAFYNCRGLTEILLTGAGNVGKEAFYGCVNVSELNISGNVTSIGDNAFYGIKHLSVAPDNVDYIIEDNILYTSDMTTLVLNLDRKRQSVTVPASVTVISNYAFTKSTQLTSVTFANGSALSSIGDYAFNRCTKLQSITLPNMLENIGGYAFQDCVQLATVNFADGRDELPLRVGDSAFNNCTVLKNIVLPEGLTSISAGMFAGTAIEEVVIPKTVISVGKNAYANCVKLRSVSILGNSKMDTTSFANCTALQNLTLAEGMTSIAANAFQNYTNLKSITIPASVESIGNYAFDGCSSLSEVIFADGSALTGIGNYAFRGCAELRAFTIPAGVETLGTYVFQNCAKLGSVTFVGSSVTALPNYTFNGCAELSSITVPAGVTSIGTNAFQNCVKLASVVFADNDTLKTIGAYVFDGCALLTSITLPESLTTINNYAFRGSGLTSITIPEKVSGTLGTYAFQNCANLASVVFDGNKITTIGTYAFGGCELLTSITIPSSVTTINGSAFKGSGLTSIIIPSGVNVLGTYSFQNCKSLKTVEFKGSTIGTSTSAKNVIGSYMFQNCDELESVTLPANIVKIDSYAFDGCSKLSIEIPAKVTTIANTSYVVFGGVKSITVAAGNKTYKAENNVLYSANGKTLHAVAGGPYDTFVIPKEVTAISRYAFYGITVNALSFATDINLPTIGTYAFAKSKIQSITIPSCVTRIDTYAFNSSGLTSITIPATVEKIGTYAFTGCASLTSVEFKGQSVATTDTSNYADKLANYMFKDCVALDTVTLPASIKTLGSGVFQNCTALTGITLPDGIALIDTNAFDGSGLTSITLPAELATIEDKAFQNTKLTQISFPSKLTKIDSYAFSGSKLASVTIPANIEVMAGNIFNGCTSLTRAEFLGNTINTGTGAATLNNLASNMFKDCTSLSSVTLPVNLVTINTNAFQNCTSLTSITLGDKIETIGNYAFDGSGLTSVVIPESVKTIGSYAFGGTMLTTVSIPKNVTSIGASAFLNCGSLGSVSFTETDGSLTTGRNSAFGGTNVSSVSIPKTVTSIGTNAFKDCASLTTITFAEDSALETIGANAFDGSGLTSVIIPKSVKTIGDYAFQNCDSLSSVTFATDSVLSSIGAYAFAGSAIESIIIPKTVTSIGSYAFTNCGSLTTVEFADEINLSTIGEGTFLGSAITTIIIPVSVTSIGNVAFKDCASLETITFAAGSLLSAIGESAFSGCGGITEITLPDSVTSVGARAFDGWQSTQKIVMTASEDVADEWNLQWESGSQAEVEWPTEEIPEP